MSAGTRALLARALERRAPLREGGRTTAFRWINGAGDGVPGLTLDLFGDVGVLSTYDARDPGSAADAASELLPLRAVYWKARPREAGALRGEERATLAPALPIRGEPVEAADVREQGLVFRIRPGEGLAVGLYLDMRQARGWVHAHARGATLLNCFAYTGAFSIAARDGGAARAVDVDLSRRSLAWGEENARLNGQSPPPADRLAGDVFDWLRRLARKGVRFDAVVLDPPGFSRGKARTFSASRDWPALVARAVPLVAPGGWLLAACNVAALPARRFEAALAEGVRRAGRTAEEVARADASPVDFPVPRGEEPPLKVRVLRLGVVTSGR
ncbi:MAG TPA: class I SAM-dependent methyltransferase [Myxococcaceae bacterium]|nr:class I SAM-dependent methyltransferase [Myxococcaceae bacterium]